jgi:hypothetical protein
MTTFATKREKVGTIKWTHRGDRYDIRARTLDSRAIDDVVFHAIESRRAIEREVQKDSF